MEGATLGRAFSVWVVVALLVGMGLVMFRRGLLSGIGVVLLIVGLISLMPAFRFTVLREA